MRAYRRNSKVLPLNSTSTAGLTELRSTEHLHVTAHCDGCTNLGLLCHFHGTESRIQMDVLADWSLGRQKRDPVLRGSKLFRQAQPEPDGAQTFDHEFQGFL